MEKKKILLIILIPLIIILFSTRLLIFNENFYLSQIPNNNLDNQKLSENLAINLLDYFQGKSDLSSSFTYKERLHLEDVKHLMHLSSLLLYTLIIIALITFIKCLHAYKIRKTFKILFHGSLLTLILILVILLLSLVSFDSLFYYFHIIFFSNDYWILSSDSLLIKLFPSSFFYSALNLIILRSFLISLFLSLPFILLKAKRLNKTCY